MVKMLLKNAKSMGREVSDEVFIKSEELGMWIGTNLVLERSLPNGFQGWS